MRSPIIERFYFDRKHIPSPQGELFPVSSSSIFPKEVVVVPCSPALLSELLDTRGCQGPDFRLSMV